MRAFSIAVLSGFASGNNPARKRVLRELAKFGFTAAVLATVLFSAQCVLFHEEPEPEPEPPGCEVQASELFAGCFEGFVTDPVDGGKVKIILLPANEENLSAITGCVLFSLADVSEEILLTGETACLPSQGATLTGTRPNGGTLEFTVVRAPEEGDAATLDVEPVGGLPFVNANGLTRCAQPETACQ